MTAPSPLAARMARLGTETAFEVLARARALEAEGRSILHFEMGEPDFDTPAHVVDAGVEALRGGWTHYGPAAGLPDLRAAVAEHVTATRGIPATAANVVICPGAKPILFYACLALLGEGDEALVPDPAFPIYASMVRFAGARAVPYPLPAERGFTADPADLAARMGPRTKLIFLNSPGNPCGGVLRPEDLHALAEVIRPTGSWVLSDEIYADILYEGEHRSLLALPGMAERGILVDGFSKSFAMTGWRLGYGVLPPELAAAATRLQINSVSCTASFTQRAGLAALRGPRDGVRAMVEEFRTRRDAIVTGLRSVRGFDCVPPRGAFYAWVDVSGTGLPGREVARRLLEEAGVACVAGTAFGESGESFVRFSFAASLGAIGEAVERMRRMFGRN